MPQIWQTENGRTDLVTRWERKRSDLALVGAYVDAAALIDQFIADLKEISNNDLLMSLRDAARATGYSADHLSRLVRTGRLTNHGRKNAPRVLLSECPRKPPRIAKYLGEGYDPLTDARSLRVRR